MSYLINTLQGSPEDQRVPKAAAHLKARVFSRLSDDHVLALALLPTLSAISAQAYKTMQVVRADYLTQDAALEAHLSALELPLNLNDLSAEELAHLIEAWSVRASALPRPFRTYMEALLAEARALTRHS